MAATPNLSQKRITAPGQQPVLLANLPKIPVDVKSRFPSMQRYETDLKEWIRKSNSQLGGVAT